MSMRPVRTQHDLGFHLVKPNAWGTRGGGGLQSLSNRTFDSQSSLTSLNIVAHKVVPPALAMLSLVVCLLAGSLPPPTEPATGTLRRGVATPGLSTTGLIVFRVLLSARLSSR